MARTEVMDLTRVCQSFPEMPKPEIQRENFLDTIDTIFQGGTELVVVEGTEGIGKTTLLAQFAIRHPNHTLSLFIRPTSRWAYDPDILRYDLCNQIQWILCQEELASIEDATDVFLRNGWAKLRKLTMYRKDTFYFVVDGLDDIPAQESQIREIILSMFPFGLPDFRFLLSGDLDQLSEYFHRGLRLKSYPLSGFTLEQTVEFFKDFNVDRQPLEEVHRICQKVPGYLAAVRRILQSGTNLQSLLEEMPSKLSDLLQIEWRNVQTDNDEQLNLLAIIAHDRRQHSLENLARLLNLEADTAKELLQDLGFLSIEPESHLVTFVSEAFCKFAADELRHLKEKVTSLLIDDLNHDPDSNDARNFLPVYLEQAGRLDDLLDYLSPDHFPKMLQISQSLSLAKRQADLGVNTARNLCRDGDLLRFSLHKSVMIGLDGAELWHSEIEARMALNDYDSAFTLAQSTVLKEERLHLLTIIAKAKREKGLSPDPELIEQIRQLYDQIDPTTLGEQAIEIASNLLYSNLNLAIEMVEKATNTDMDENALDWAFAKLSIAALSSNSQQYQAADTLENIRSRIQNPKVRRFSDTASLFIKECSAAEAIAQVKKLENTDDRLFLLRRWALDNREREDAAEVVEFALDLAIKSAPYSPNAGILREIATPIPFVSDKSRAAQLVRRFDGQKGTVERYGPTEDYVRLQLLLAQTEIKHDFEAARNRLVDVFFYITELDELAVKTGCMARFVTMLAEIDPQMRLESADNMSMHTSAQECLKSYSKELLDVTADHYYTTRSIIKALAKTEPDAALELIQALNTQARRDLATLDLVESAIQVPTDRLDLSFVENALNKFWDLNLRDEALLSIFDRLSSEKNESLAKASLPLIDHIKDIRDAAKRCDACCLAYSFLVEQDTKEYSGLLSHILKMLNRAWGAIDVEWRKVDIGFKITQSLAENTLETAREYLERTEKLRDKNILSARSTAFTYLGCLQLAIRAYSGLLPNSLNMEEDINRLARLIDRVPSNGERARLWAELALRCYINEQSGDFKRIVTDHIKPLLLNIPDEDAKYQIETTVVVAPALYYAHQRTALEQIFKLPLPERDMAYAQIISFIFQKQPPSDPYDILPGSGFAVTFEEIIDICGLLELMDHDALIFHIIRLIADSVVLGPRKGYFTKQQKADIINHLEKIIRSKLPNERHIKHDGYKIVAQAQVAKIQRVKTQEWLSLIESARAISNLADSALVLCEIAAALPNREASIRRQVLDEAMELVEKIPAVLDKIRRYEEFASTIAGIDSNMSKKCLRLAMQAAVESDKPELYSAQRRIIDLAHKLVDKDLAASLASIADDDPARIRTRSNLKRRFQILDLKQKIANQSASLSDLTSSPKLNYSQAAWMLLGTLNANRVIPINLEYTRDLVQVASNLSFMQAYPILALVIENATKSYSKTNQARTYVRSIFEATLRGTELAARMAVRSSVQLEQAKCQAIMSPTSKSVLIQAGDREGAIEFLKKWFDQKVQDYLKICDPYFGPDDLDILYILQSVKPACKVKILTSRKHHSQSQISIPWEEAYRTYWRLRVSEQDPPDTEIVITGTKSSEELPIHDRWWLTRGGGIRMGTSFNALGIKKDSEISYLTEEEAAIREAGVDCYLRRKKREHRGERVTYSLFTL
jgi:hypothetical protein